MKQKRFLSACFLSNIAIMSFFATPLSSCSTQKSYDEIIVMENKSVVTNEHKFSIKFTFQIECQKEVVVEIINPSIHTFWIEQNIIQLDDKGRGAVEFGINDSVQTNSLLSFDLNFKYKMMDGTSYEKEYYGFSAYYIDESTYELDYPYIQSNTQTIHNTHIFQFTIWFEKQPQSDPIEVQLRDDASHKLSLQNTSTKLIPSSGFYRIEIIINLDISVFTTTIFCFSLDINFINSFGKQQQNHFYGLTAKFQKELTDDIPQDYYDIEYANDNRIILKGLKPEVNKLEAGNYKELIVPNDVTEIKESAFSDKHWFKNIRYLYIPSSVKTINVSAFAGLNNVTEIDLIDYDDEPQWANTHNIFDASSFQTIGGYVWTKNIPNLDNFNDLVHRWGLPDLWLAFNEEMVSNASDFRLSSDRTILHGVNTYDGGKRWKQIKVIKIPNTVKSISINAFKDLKEIPYEKPNTNDFTNKYETRRLILTNNIDTLPNYIFQNVGISGPILMYCDNLTELPWGAFAGATDYNYPKILDVEVEPFYFVLSDSFNIQKIGDFCFNMTPFANANMSFPASVQQINDYAFQGHQFNSVSFTSNIIVVGERAFSNVFSYPFTPTLTSIDLSQYKVVLNPGSRQEDWTFVPEWVNFEKYIFENACVDDNEDHYVYVSQKFHDELNKKEGGFDKWFKNFLLIQAIPSSWKYQIK